MQFPKLSQESILLIICALGLGVLIYVGVRPTNPTATIGPEAPLPDTAPPATAAPYDLAYNMADSAQGYNFGPPVVNSVMPARTQGIAGGVANMLGCKTCG